MLVLVDDTAQDVAARPVVMIAFYGTAGLVSSGMLEAHVGCTATKVSTLSGTRSSDCLVACEHDAMLVLVLRPHAVFVREQFERVR